MYRSSVLLATVFCAVLLLTSTVSAQENATITGTVVDPTGAVVPNVDNHSDQHRNRPGETRDVEQLGHLCLPNVGVGQFTLNATAPGFHKFISDGHRCEHRSDSEGGHRPHSRQRKHRQ